MKTAVVAVVCLLMTAALTNAQFFIGGRGPAPFFGAPPFFGPRFGPPPFFGPPPPRFGPRFGQGRGLAYIGSLGLLGLGGPLGVAFGAAGLAGLAADDLTRF